MPNFISEDQVERAMVQKLQHLHGFDVLECHTEDPEDLNDGLKATRECVINIPTVELAETVVGCGNASGRRVDKFKAFGLTPVAAACVKAPLIAECHGNLECKVIN